MLHSNITRAKPKFKKATSAQKCATIDFYERGNKLHIQKI